MSVLGHVAIGVATARRVTSPDEPNARLGTSMIALAALALLPDIDFVLQELAPSITAFEHRAAIHSIAVAVGIGALIGLAIHARGGQRPMAWGVIAGAVIASHGVLDAFGDGDVGVALLWPFSDARFLAPWHLLPNPSLALFSRGAATLALEFLVFLPLWLYAFVPRRRAVPNHHG